MTTSNYRFNRITVSMVKWLSIFLAMCLLAACGERDCVDADDWGYPKILVSSEYEESEIKGDGLTGQEVPAIDSGQILIDVQKVPLVITIGDENQWTSWFGGDATTYKPEGADFEISWDPKEMVPNKECQYKVNSSFTGTKTYTDDENKSYTDIFEENHDHKQRAGDDPRPEVSKARLYQGNIHSNAQVLPCPAAGVLINNPDLYADCRVPCFMRGGMGLYIGLSHNNGPESDIVVTRHIPDAKYPEVAYDVRKTPEANHGPAILDSNGMVETDEEGNIVGGKEMDGYLIKGFAYQELPGSFTRDRLYFKILDRYYPDNYGYYQIRLKEGTRNPSNGPIERVVEVVTGPVDQVMERLWRGITQNATYLQFLRVTMALAGVIYAYMFLMGMIQQPKNDFIVNLIRIGIISQLFDPDSFDFFYNNFFSAFFEGIADIIALIVTPFTDYDPASPWYSLDQLLRKLWSEETHAKVWALLFSNAVGFIFIIVFYVALIIFLVAVIKAMIVYLAAYVSMAILVVMGPIFIITLLFPRLRELFEEWVNQFIAFAIELILLFAAVGMFGAIVIYFAEQYLGYRVCWNTWWNFSIFDAELFNFKFWLPDIRYDNDHLGPIWMDVNDDGVRELNEYAKRYFDMPYLDTVRDKRRIIELAAEKNFMDLSDVVIFMAVIILMYAFMEFVPVLANLMKGASIDASASIAGAGATAWRGIQAVTIGGVGSGKSHYSPSDDKPGATKKKNTTFGNAFYKTTGRDGGILGGVMRGIVDVGKVGARGYGGTIMGDIKDVLGGAVSGTAKRLNPFGKSEGILETLGKAGDERREALGNLSTGIGMDGPDDVGPAGVQRKSKSNIDKRNRRGISGMDPFSDEDNFGGRPENDELGTDSIARSGLRTSMDPFSDEDNFEGGPENDELGTDSIARSGLQTPIGPEGRELMTYPIEVPDDIVPALLPDQQLFKSGTDRGLFEELVNQLTVPPAGNALEVEAKVAAVMRYGDGFVESDVRKALAVQPELTEAQLAAVLNRMAEVKHPIARRGASTTDSGSGTAF